MSPKIYFIQNQEGKFYNSKDKVWYSNIINANYDRKKQEVQKVLELPVFKECTVYETTEEHYIVSLQYLTAKTVLSISYALQNLSELDSKLPLISQVNKNLHSKLKLAKEACLPFIRMRDELVESNEDLHDDLSGLYQEYITEFSKAEVFNMRDLIDIKQAYDKSPESINGIAKKILK